MRATIPLIALLLTVAAHQTAASDPARSTVTASDPLERRFRETVAPFIRTYCVDCHAKQKPKGDLNLAGYTTFDSVAGDIDRWEAVMEELEAEKMPPIKAKRQPDETLRREVIGWIREFRKHEATRNAGDPGPAPARRLSNAEYDHTVRDLTGVDIRPTR